MNETIIDNETGQAPLIPAELEGVRTARLLAFFFDYLIIGLLCVPFFVVIGFLGIITIGLAWALLPFVPPIIALLYTATTLGGPQQATLGMRFMGIRIKKLDGKQVDPLLAALHAILFWVIHTFAVVLPLFITFFSSRKRLLHDVALGTYVARV